MAFQRRQFFHDSGNSRCNRPPMHHPYNNSQGHDRFGPNKMNGCMMNRPGVNNRPGHVSHGRGSAGRVPRTRNDNTFGKFHDLEDFKNFRRNVKLRKSLDEETSANQSRENKCDGLMFISPVDVLEMKRRIQNELQSKGSSCQAVEVICQEHARFHYYSCYKDYHKAKSSALKKSPALGQKSRNVCIPCDCYFTDQNTLDMHYKSGLHIQVSKIFASLMKVGHDYLASYGKPHLTPVDSVIAEETGILVNLTDDPIDYSDINVTEMDKESFILAAYERKMKDQWPQPNSQFFCRSCNYSEFPSQEMLDRHLKSARHLDFERHYSEAFCISCQHHYGDAEQMQKHVQSAEHKKTADLMEFTRSHATHYWNLWQSKQKSELQNNFVNKSNDYSSMKLNHAREREVCGNFAKKDGQYPALGRISLSVPFVDDDIGNNKYSGSMPKIYNSPLSIPFVDNDIINNKTSRTGTFMELSILKHPKSPIKRMDHTKSLPKKDSPSSATLSSSRIGSSVSSDKLIQLGNSECSQGVVSTFEGFSGIKCKDEGASECSVSELSSPKNSDPASLNLEKYENYIKAHCIVSEAKAEIEKIENEKKEKEEEEAKKKDNTLDDYIVPLTGFMCTVCHETLADTTEAIEHQATNSHKAKVQIHKSLFG